MESKRGNKPTLSPLTSCTPHACQGDFPLIHIGVSILKNVNLSLYIMFYKIYSFVSECPFCEALRRFFQEAGISYMYLAVDREGHAALIPELEKWLGREVDESIRTVIGFFDDPNKPPFSFLADEEALSKMLENKEFDVDRFREILLEEQQKHVRDQLMELGASEEDLDYYEKQYAKELVDEVLPVD